MKSANMFKDEGPVDQQKISFSRKQRLVLGSLSALFFVSIGSLLFYFAMITFALQDTPENRGEEGVGIVVIAVTSIIAMSAFICASLVLRSYKLMRIGNGFPLALVIGLAWSGITFLFLTNGYFNSVPFFQPFLYFSLLSGLTVPLAVVSIFLYVVLRISFGIRSSRSETHSNT